MSVKDVKWYVKYIIPIDGKQKRVHQKHTGPLESQVAVLA